MASKGSGVQLVAFDGQQKLGTWLRNASMESIESFQELSSCISFIQQQTTEDKVVILITTIVEENILQSFESLASIEAILILSESSKDIDTFPSKVIGVYPQTELLLRSLSETLDTIELQLDARSLLFNRQKEGNDNLVFYFYDLWKNHMKEQTSTKKLLADQARLLFRSSNQIKASINDFEASYKSNDVLSWLEKRRISFPYHLLISNALRTHNQQILSLARFFLDDFSKQIKPGTWGPSYNQVYFGNKLPMTLIERLEQQTKTDIIAFQCFLPVTRSRASALLEATRPSRRHDIVNVLFKIDLNNTLCATIGDTLLINMATPFYVSCVTRSTSTGGAQQLLTIVKLMALDKNDREQLFEQFIQRQQKLGRTINDLLEKMGSDISDDEALADEHIARREWSQAANILAGITDPNVRVLNKHGCLLREHMDNLPGAMNCHQQALSKAVHREKPETLIYLGLVHDNMKQYAEAYKVYSQALQWLENEKKHDSAMIARCLVGIGNAQWARGQLDEALDFAERALAIREHEIKPRNNFDIAACLGNMGNILHDQGNFERALSCATRAVNLLRECGENDPRLAAALNNLGAMHQANGNLVKAREHFQRALELVPNENHPYRRSTLANITRLDIAEEP